MATYTRSHNSSKVISFVLMIAFGLLAVIIGYATWKGGSFELRSKAATQDVLIKAWSFDKNAEGWVAKDAGSSTAGGGNFTLIIGPQASTSREDTYCTGSKKRGNYKCKTRTVTTVLDPRIEHTAVESVLKYQRNRFSMQVTMTPDVIMTRQKNPNIAQTPVTVYVSYKLQGKSVYEPAVPLRTVVSASAQEVAFDFPDAYSLKRVDAIQISFKDLRAMPNTRIHIDEIRIMGLKSIERPKPDETYTGTVTKIADDMIGLGQSAYRLQAKVGETRSLPPKPVIQEYQLMQAKGAPCRLGRFCAMFLPVQMNMEQYVGKIVTVTGTVEIPDIPEKGTENPENIPQRKSIPIIYVTSITLVEPTPIAATITTTPSP